MKAVIEYFDRTGKIVTFTDETTGVKSYSVEVETALAPSSFTTELAKQLARREAPGFFRYAFQNYIARITFPDLDGEAPVLVGL